MIKRKRATLARIFDYLKSWPQYLLPHHTLSNLMYALTRSQTGWWKKAFIHWFIRRYNVEMSEAVEPNPDAYVCFNDFFTRALKPLSRPISSAPKNLACPVDGFVSQAGNIEQGSIFQAKGQSYTLNELLAGNEEWTSTFSNGHFATLYLSPSNYHRIHMPIDGTLTGMTYVPGRLFSVNPATARTIPRLFARNERVIIYFETALGMMAIILVGAIFVGSMETTWHGMITPPHGGKINHWEYSHDPDNSGQSLAPEAPTSSQLVTLKKGAELGRFNMGSTVILLCQPDTILWQHLQSGMPVRMGQTIATIL